jgi:hypothetical protein
MRSSTSIEPFFAVSLIAEREARVREAVVLEAIEARLDELAGELAKYRRRRDHEFWLAEEQQGQAHGTLTAAANLIETLTRGRGQYSEQTNRIMADPDLRGGVPSSAVEKMAALLQNVKVDWKTGLLRQIEYLVSAENFDSFLDHADGLHRAGDLRGSGVLVSIVFEDGIRKLAKKHGVPDASVETMISGIVDKEAVTPVAGRRLATVAALRNKALHAKWEEYNLRDVSDAIRDTREYVINAL